MAGRGRDEDEARRPDVGFVATAKDGAYRAAEIVREEAAAVEHMAQRVEVLSRSIEHDVDSVERALHQMITNTNSKEEIIEELEVNSNDLLISSNKPLDQVGNSMATKSLALEWQPQTTYHVIFVFLTLSTVLLYKWGNCTFGKKDMDLDNSNTWTIPINSTTFSISLINIGSILRILKFTNNALRRKKESISKVEDKVHKIGEEVKSVANNIEEIADTVENISQQIEVRASQIQSLIRPEKKA